MVGKRALYAYDFMRNDIPGMDERERGYWRDVGTIQQYFLANLDFVQIVPVFNLYNPRWLLHTWCDRCHRPSSSSTKTVPVASAASVCDKLVGQ